MVEGGAEQFVENDEDKMRTTRKWTWYRGNFASATEMVCISSVYSLRHTFCIDNLHEKIPAQTTNVLCQSSLGALPTYDFDLSLLIFRLRNFLMLISRCSPLGTSTHRRLVWSLIHIQKLQANYFISHPQSSRINPHSTHRSR